MQDGHAGGNYSKIISYVTVMKNIIITLTFFFFFCNFLLFVFNHANLSNAISPPAILH